MNDEDRRGGGELCHRSEIAHQIILQVPVDGNVGGMRDICLK